MFQTMGELPLIYALWAANIRYAIENTFYDFAQDFTVLTVYNLTCYASTLIKRERVIVVGHIFSFSTQNNWKRTGKSLFMKQESLP